MKRIMIVFCLLPLLLGAQKIRTNEVDKFIKQKRIETFPLFILSASKNKMAVTLSSVGPALYLQLSGAGIGANRIEENDRVIFLFDNDSTVTVYSKGYQSFDIGVNVNSYAHSYKLTIPDLVKMSRYGLEALRKYHADEYDDIYISKEASEQFRKLTLLFIKELAKENLIPTAKTIAVNTVANHIGDSVTLVGRIAGSRYFFESQDATILLDVGNASPSQLLTAVIKGEDKKAFDDLPQNYYNGKLVRITGRVVLQNGKPHIGITRREQLVILQDTVTYAANAVAPAQPAAAETSTPIPASAPGFPGGYQVWMNFLNRNLKPPTNLKTGQKKIVVVQFAVSADGSVCKIQIVQSAGPAYDNEVLRVLGRMPKWKPAIENGRATAAVVTQPVTFFGAQAGAKNQF